MIHYEGDIQSAILLSFVEMHFALIAMLYLSVMKTILYKSLHFDVGLITCEQ